MVQVDKPVPKPRTIFSTPLGFVQNGQSPAAVSPQISPVTCNESQSIVPAVVVPGQYGWHPTVTVERTSSSASSASSVHTTSSSSNQPAAATTVSSSSSSETAMSSPASDKSYTRTPPPPSYPPPMPPPPRLPAHFQLPLGPPPPIPPRLGRERSLPEPIIDETDNDNDTDDGTAISVVSTNGRSSPLLESPREHRMPPGYSVSSNGDGSVCGESSSNVSSCDMYEFLRPAVTADLPAVQNSPTMKAEGESVCLSGWVNLKTGKKNCARVWASIRHRQLLFMPDIDDECPIVGPFDLSRLLFVGKSTDNASDIIVVLRPTNQNRKTSHANAEVVRFAPEENFAFWISLLAKCNCPGYPALHEAIEEMDAGGKIYIREGITGVWAEGYAFTRNDRLCFFTHQDEVVREVDMRKFSVIKMDMQLADYCNHISHSHLGPLLIMLEGSSLYLQNENDAATKTWFTFLQAQGNRPAKHLSECRLTADDIPMIMDKCIKFVATYGLKQQGLYRRNGPNTMTKAFFDALKKDPFGTHLTPNNDETINAIADVLRTFLRQLETPLVPEKVQSEMYNICDRYRPALLECKNLPDAVAETKRVLIRNAKANEYRNVIDTFPPVHFQTLKRLIDHLIEVNSYESDNLASIDNLSRVFGPTIFVVDKCNDTPSSMFSRTGQQISVMHDLIDLYDEIFKTPASIRAIGMSESFESKCVMKPRAEGFLIPVHLYEKDNQCFNVQSNWTAEEIVEYKVKKLDKPTAATALALFEVVKGGTLVRRVSDNETIKSIALERWIEWKATDAFLLLKKDRDPFNPANTRPFAEEIKIAEPGSKSFKSAQLKIDNGKKIQQFPKGEKLQKPQKEWTIDETIWFIGHTPERKPPTNFPYTTTFLLKNGKYNNKSSGFCVAFVDEVQRTQWLNAVAVCQRDYSSIVLVPDL
uniref:Rho-GAP domain-containing protein n=1 Tax=Panagrellus redivivus TaxID=6233 RepID=A0A7E4ZSU0_PANRE